MTRYYVYHVKTENPEERMHAFVSDPLLFAREQFDPDIMEFCGVSVEAETPQLAQEEYTNPKASTILCACEEPLCTKVQREFISKDTQNLKKRLMATEDLLIQASIILLNKKIDLDLLLLQNKLSALSRCLNSLNANVLPELYYEQLKRSYTDQILRSKYRPYDSKDAG